MTQSVKTHWADLSIVPAGHLFVSLESDKLSGARFIHHALFLALVEELLLTLSEGDVLDRPILLLILRETEVFGYSVNPLVALSREKRRPQGGPGRHQKLLLVWLHVDDAVLIFHQVFKAWGGVEYGRDRHRRTHKTHEGHYYFNSLVIYYNYYNHNYKVH